MEYALKLSNVCKQYDSSEFALDKVTFSLPVGTVMGFVGENEMCIRDRYYPGYD